MITICLQGWHWYEADGERHQTYADMLDKPDGYCVYTRTDTDDEQEPFDIEDERDFDNYDEALREAKARAERLGAEVSVY